MTDITLTVAGGKVTFEDEEYILTDFEEGSKLKVIGKIDDVNLILLKVETEPSSRRFADGSVVDVYGKLTWNPNGVTHILLPIFPHELPYVVSPNKPPGDKEPTL